MEKKPYGSQFLYSEDLLSGGQYRTVTVKVSKFHPESSIKTAAGKMVPQIVLGFEGKDKMLALNSTNRTVMIAVTGEQPGERWIGREVKLEVRNVTGADRQPTVGIRIIPPVGTTLRKSVIDRLGTKAVWQGAAKPQPEPTREPGDEA